MNEKESKPWRIMFYGMIIIPTILWLFIFKFLPVEENTEKRDDNESST